MTKLSDYPVGTVDGSTKLAGLDGSLAVKIFPASSFVGPAGPESQVPGPTGATGPALTPNEHAAFNEAKVTAIQTADIDWVINVDSDTRANKNLPASIAGDMTGHMLKFRTSDNAWLDLGQWRGNTGLQGSIGPAGGGLVPDGYGILNEAKVAAVQAADVNYIYVVDPLGDTRVNKSTPAGIVGDMERHIIRYDGTTNAWTDYGQFTGIQGPVGPQGNPGPASTVPGPASTVAGPAGPVAWGPVQPWSNGLACSGSAPRTVVTLNGETYVCKTTHTAGPSFDASKFDKIAEKGSNGTAGSNGSAGVGVPTGGTTGQVLAKIDATNYNTQWVTPSGGGGGPTSFITRYRQFCDFIGGEGPVTPTLTPQPFNDFVALYGQGSGSLSYSQGTVSSTAGVIQLAMGATAATQLSIATHRFVPYSTPSGKTGRFTCRARDIGGALTSTNLVYYIGASSAAVMDGSQAGIGFWYDSTSNFWQAVTGKTTGAYAETRTITTVAGNDALWHDFEIRWNAAYTSVSFLIDSVVVATHTTNIYNAAGFQTYYGIHMKRTTGTVNWAGLVDWMEYVPDTTFWG